MSRLISKFEGRIDKVGRKYLQCILHDLKTKHEYEVSLKKELVIPEHQGYIKEGMLFYFNVYKNDPEKSRIKLRVEFWKKSEIEKAEKQAKKLAKWLFLHFNDSNNQTSRKAGNL